MATLFDFAISGGNLNITKQDSEAIAKKLGLKCDEGRIISLHSHGDVVSIRDKTGYGIDSCNYPAIYVRHKKIYIGGDDLLTGIICSESDADDKVIEALNMFKKLVNSGGKLKVVQ